VKDWGSSIKQGKRKLLNEESRSYGVRQAKGKGDDLYAVVLGNLTQKKKGASSRNLTIAGRVVSCTSQRKKSPDREGKKTLGRQNQSRVAG